jgi:hypothetical protein
MLDWTTSFLSDATILKLGLRVCQTVSFGVLQVVGFSCACLNPWLAPKETPHPQGAGLDENQPEEATPEASNSTLNPLIKGAIGKPVDKTL